MPFADEEQPYGLRLQEPCIGWAEEGQRLGGELRRLLGTLAVRIDHIGSTSVPGLPAKDCIDLMVRTEKLDEDRLTARSPGAATGYDPNRGTAKTSPGASAIRSSSTRRRLERDRATSTFAYSDNPTSGTPCFSVSTSVPIRLPAMPGADSRSGWPRLRPSSTTTARSSNRPPKSSCSGPRRGPRELVGDSTSVVPAERSPVGRPPICTGASARNHEVPVDQQLVNAAIAQADRRWPDRDAVAAAVRLQDGSVVTGVSLSNFNAAMTLCAETGPICAVYTSGQSVVASVCVSRDLSSG